MRYIRKKIQRGWTQGFFSRTSKESTVQEKEPTHATDIQHSAIREEDKAEEPRYVFDKSDHGKWIREEAVVDSGAVECVTSKRRRPHLSRRDARITTRRNVDMLRAP